jgi:acetyltransferase-like isoleucine patch superfamily enzyme
MDATGQSTMLQIIFPRPVAAEVVEALAELGIKHYTETDQVHGVGQSGPVLGSRTWPGDNAAIMAVVDDDEQARRVAGVLRRLRDRRRVAVPGTGIRVFACPCARLL